MTPDKIKALREKHHENRYSVRADWPPVIECATCQDAYPCDVIRVLDAWEANSKKALDALDHINTMRVDEDDLEWLQTAEFTLKGEL